ncbi:hypothetical protein [Acrocarpospora catenulata]|uniref:GltB/FmdC/FwdC-like GXGXG domain-containing protein n=1 Tax=Acrocarpospora catenulata TaxID=2836182 RepID=UPI001BD95A68|nr:hypothetical protein [Acrocarpospora catenulata]
MDIDLSTTDVRTTNAALRALPAGTTARLVNPAGKHNLAVGLTEPITVEIDGTAGYYAGGLGKNATVLVRGTAGWGAGENLMSGLVQVDGDASQSLAASAHGGTIVVRGDASLRAGISLKGATVLVGGDVGDHCGFMAQAGTILIGGDAGRGLGDSLYEAVIYVAGKIKDLGADARIEDLTAEDVELIADLAKRHGFDHIDPENVKRVASAKQLYHWGSP